jgi:hypothetical protein
MFTSTSARIVLDERLQKRTSLKEEKETMSMLAIDGQRSTGEEVRTQNGTTRIVVCVQWWHQLFIR